MYLLNEREREREREREKERERETASEKFKPINLRKLVIFNPLINMIT